MICYNDSLSIWYTANSNVDIINEMCQTCTVLRFSNSSMDTMKMSLLMKYYDHVSGRRLLSELVKN